MKNQRLPYLFSLLSLALALSIFVFSFIGCSSQEVTAEDVVLQYSDAIGGADKLLAKKTRITKGEFSVPDMGFSGEFVQYLAPPNLTKTEITISDMQVLSGVKDEIAWDSNPMMGDRVLQGGELSAAIRKSCWDPMVEWNKYWDTAVVTEQEEETDALKISFNSTKKKSQAIAYFDKETHLLKKLITFDDETRSTTWFSDYQIVDGLNLAHSISTDLGGQIQIEMLINSIEHDSNISPEIFEFPEAIKALLD